MNDWVPASREDVEAQLSDESVRLDRRERALLEAIRIPLRQVPVSSHPGERVWVVAEYQGRLVYWSDVEEGWGIDTTDEDGGIRERCANQWELGAALHQLFDGGAGRLELR